MDKARENVKLQRTKAAPKMFVVGCPALGAAQPGGEETLREAAAVDNNAPNLPQNTELT